MSDHICLNTADVWDSDTESFVDHYCCEDATMWVTYGNGPPTPMCAECADIVEPWALSIAPIETLCDE